MISVFESNFESFVLLHSECIIRYCNKTGNRYNRTSDFDNIIQKHFSHIIINFKELLEASPQKLFQMRDYFDGLKSKDQKEILEKLKLQGLYDKFKKKTDSFLKSDDVSIYNSDHLIQKIDIVTCPYCNETNLYSFYAPRYRNERRNFDWDHIIPQEDYPFLAISFFNLIPSCKVCNSLKGFQKINISPFEKIDVNKFYKFYITGHSTDFLKDSKSIIVNLLISNSEKGIEIENVMNIVCLDVRYGSQKEFIKDLLNKKRVYESPLWESISNIITQDKTMSKNDVEGLFFKQYNTSFDYYKSPLSKLTADIIKTH